jgi:TRAP-type C4-dicarboxylate transport system permease small subunit
MGVLVHISRILSRALIGIAAVILVFLMLLACGNMLFRAVWVPIKGTFELMGFFGAVVTAFALGQTQIQKGHIAVTVLSGRFSPAVERILDGLSHLICSVFFGLIAWRTAVWAFSLIETGELSETLRIIYYPFAFAVAFGNLILALVLMVDFLQVLTGEKGGSP